MLKRFYTSFSYINKMKKWNEDFKKQVAFMDNFSYFQMLNISNKGFQRYYESHSSTKRKLIDSYAFNIFINIYSPI